MTLLIRREALQRMGGFVQSHDLPLVDIPTLMQLSLMGEFFYDPQPLGCWRHYIGQTTKTYLADSLKKACTLSLQFYEALDPRMQSRLTVNRDSIKKYFHSAVQIAYARMGRYKLIQKDAAGARKDYVTAMFYRGASRSESTGGPHQIVNGRWCYKSAFLKGLSTPPPSLE